MNHSIFAGWVSEYKKRGALWIHDGNSQRPHALLSSGKHSNGFFNSELVMEYPFQLNKACRDLASLLLVQHGLTINSVNRVVGPAMGAITLAHDVARHISVLNDDGHLCLRAYTEKEEMMNGAKKMVFKRATIHPGEHILLVEDVLTTGGSVDMTAQAVVDAGGIVLPFVAVLVNRSGLAEVSGKKIVALIDQSMPMWAPEECPLCKAGSEAIKPKGKENWESLNAVYT